MISRAVGLSSTSPGRARYARRCPHAPIAVPQPPLLSLPSLGRFSSSLRLRPYFASSQPGGSRWRTSQRRPGRRLESIMYRNYDAWKTATPWDGLRSCPVCDAWLDDQGVCQDCWRRDWEEAETRNETHDNLDSPEDNAPAPGRSAAPGIDAPHVCDERRV
jgi:hypothetical protein